MGFPENQLVRLLYLPFRIVRLKSWCLAFGPFALFVFFVFLVLFFSSACVSQANKRVDFIPAHVSSVYIFSFMNDTKISGLSAKFREFLVEELEERTALEVVDSPRLADAVLEGRMANLFFQGLTYTATGEMDRARYYLEVIFSFRDVRHNEVLLKDRRVSGLKKVHLVTAPVINKPVAREELLRSVARKLVHYCRSGEPENINLMYGYEDENLQDDDGVLVGGDGKNYDMNNDGIDDRLQNLTNSDGLTNTRRQ